MSVLAADPCANVTVKRSVPKHYDLWTNEQFYQFLAVAEDDEYGALWHLLCWTGMRISEALGQRSTDIDLVGQALRVRQVVVQDKSNHNHPIIKPSPKTAAGRRTITFSRATSEYLEWYKEEHQRRDGLISCSPNGEPLTHSGMQRRLKSLCRKAGVPFLSAHGIRHLHATHLARAGVPIRTAMDRLGQTSPNVLLLVYQQVDQEMRTDVVDKLEALLISPALSTALPTPAESDTASGRERTAD